MSAFAPKVLPPLNPTATATSTTSTAAVALGDVNGWMRFKADGGKIYVKFGDSAVAAATATNAWPIADGQELLVWIDPTLTTHFRALAATGTPNLLRDKA